MNNRHLIPNYGERYRHGEAIATGFVESTVNEVVSKRFCKKQQMQWSKEGAHLLLQTRVRTLNGELGAILASIMASATPFCFCTTQKHLTVKRARSSRA
jgi:hypothetical protein